MKKIAIIILLVLFIIGVFSIPNIENYPENLSIEPNYNIENKTISYENSSGAILNTEESRIETQINFNGICPYESLCSGNYIVYNNNVFCEDSCIRKYEDTCNYNRICEGFERDCLDCQCFDGIICGGICYRNTDLICDNGFMREDHGFPEGSLEFEINFPRFLEKDIWTKGNVTIINNNDYIVENDIYWNLDNLEADINLFDLNKVSLKPRENMTISFMLKGTEVSDSIVGKNFLSRRPETSSLMVSSNTNSRKMEFVVYRNGKKCADGYFNYQGMCVGDIFFFGANCDSGECLDRMNWWDRKKTVKAKGDVEIGLVFVNIPERYKQEVLNWSEKISKWYFQEGKKYTGKDIINLSFIVSGNYSMNISFEEDLLPSNLYNSKVYKKRSNYDINIVIVPDIPSIVGDTAAINYDGKFIALKMGAATDITLAHEIAHSFGCKDLYDKWEICKTRWKGSLMCEEAGKKGIQSLELGNCAGEMGWGDLNNNLIVDIEE